MNYTNYKKLIRAIFILIFFVLISKTWSQSLTYYVDSILGDDNSNGQSVQSAWKSLDKVNSTTFKPGDKILFKAGSKWNGQLNPKGSGSAGNSIVISRYGAGNPPNINGNGQVTNTVSLLNQEYWTISDLEVTNNSGTSDNLLRRGVYIIANNYGTIHNIQLLRLIVRDVNSYINASVESTKNYGGIIIETSGSGIQTNFDNLLIEECSVIDCDRTGIATLSSWSERTLTTITNWYPNTNVIIRNNWIERSGANGLIVRVSDKPLIEKNVFKQCGLKASGNAMFVFNCDDAVIQYNEAMYTVYNSGDTDASGFDADYRCKRTIIQYNYSHDNDDGFLVVCCQGGSDRFNDGTIVRYNISQNDGGKGSSSGAIVYLSGTTSNTIIHNNVVYSGPNNAFKKVIFHNSWSGYPDKTSYYNNIFYIQKTPVYSFASSTNNSFDYNLFYGLHSTNEPFDLHKITTDPMFANPGSAIEGLNTLIGYKLQNGSPCIDAGKTLSNHAVKDFFGNTVPGNGKVDIGAHEYNGVPSSINDEKELSKNFVLEQNYPNPFNPETVINYQISAISHVTLKVYDVLGSVVRTLVDEIKQPGKYHSTFSTLHSTLSSGIYFYTLRTGNYSETKKMLLFK